MKKSFILLFLLIFNFVYCQISKTEKIINLEPSMRLGINFPLHFGNNMLANEYRSSIGFTSNFSVIQIYKIKFSGGYEFQKYNENRSSIGKFTSINKHTYILQTDYSIPILKTHQLVPFISYSATNLNFKDGTYTMAKQHTNEIKIGSYFDYQLNSTYSLFFSLNYCKILNNIEASKADQKYYGTSNSFNFSLGIEFN